MQSHSDSCENHDGMHAYVPHIVVAIAFSLLFLGWVLFTHGTHAQPLPDQAHSIAVERNAQTLAYYGDGRLKVLQFYANPSEGIKRGTPALVCYGVSNAASVTIEPSLGETWPSTGRCIEAMPAQDTEYKLTARDAAGHEQVQTVLLRVKR